MRLRGIRRAAIAALACLAVVASGLTVVALSAAPANAWATTDFNAANIVDDALFYDGDAMTAAEVQSFLNERVPRCTLGDKGREVGKSVSWSGQATKLASKCLRDYSMTTSSQAANAYCKAYAGAKGEKAATIVAKVGKACGISQRVLLIMLEKEQSLVGDSWPNELQYFRAMGYACPDSGPGGSANCDPSQGGFYKQVYRAAWQLKVYKANPNDYRYRPFQKNTVQYSVPLSCGTSTVSIENWATAALYIYTPYRPNKAALTAGWGTGDSCSTYGNRNFFNFWNQWFGSVRANLQMTADIKKVYDAATAAGTPFGDPVSARKKITANGGGYEMVFEKGMITQSTTLGKTFGLRDMNLVRAYLEAGGASGAWGFLASNPSGSKVEGRDDRRLTLQNGTLVHSTLTAGVGIRFMPTAVTRAWIADGAQTGEFGFPNASAAMRNATSGSQRFIGGTMMVSGAKRTLVTPSDVTRWQALGGYNAIGFYTAPPAVLGDKSYRETDKGTVYFLSPTNALLLPSSVIRTAYIAAKGPAGAWGWPVSAPRAIKGGLAATFSGGTAVYNTAAKRTVFLSGGTYQDWMKRGGTKSSLGYPTESTRVLKDGRSQAYAKQVIFYGPKATLALQRDTVLAAYLAAGGPASRWGWPVAAQRAIKNGVSLKLSAGYAIYDKKARTTVFLTAGAYKDWVKRGGTKSSYGYPNRSTKVVSDGAYQQYRKYYVFLGPKKTISLRKGAATKAYLAAGGPQGSRWGWPVASPKTAGNGTVTIAFSKGTLKITKTGKVTFK